MENCSCLPIGGHRYLLLPVNYQFPITNEFCDLIHCNVIDFQFTAINELKYQLTTQAIRN